MADSTTTTQLPTKKATIISLNMKNIKIRNRRYPGLVAYLRQLIQRYQPDAICMQEIGKLATTTLGSDLGMPYSQWTPYGYMGVGTLSMHPITNLTSVRLEDRIGIIPRSAHVISIDRSASSQPPITLANLHLCHQKEANRVYQLSRLYTTLQTVAAKQNPPQYPDFLIGDFNAIQPSDYTDEELTAIQESREAFALEPAKGTVTHFMTHNMGYVIPEYKGPTCPYKTRVDYICPSQQVMDTPCQQLEYVVDREAMDAKHTDHCASIVRLY